eukprot:9474591-Alexandrium_andersonii.AAC.1
MRYRQLATAGPGTLVTGRAPGSDSAAPGPPPVRPRGHSGDVVAAPAEAVADLPPPPPSGHRPNSVFITGEDRHRFGYAA